MDGSRYWIKGRIFDSGSPGLQEALAQIHGTPERPRCLCVAGGVEMYVARHAEYLVKRMPATGHQHHPCCPSFEPEAGGSGRGELMGDAIVEHAPDRVELHTDFALARVAGKASATRAEAAEPGGVHSPRKRLSMRALVHYLYEQAGLNRWFPAMEGRRNQGVLHKYLTEAARSVWVKGAPLADRLYVPEPFRLEFKDEIGARRRNKLAVLHTQDATGRRKMAIVMGEFNGVDMTPAGVRIAVKHMADAPLTLDTKAWASVRRRYGALLQARDADVEHPPRILMAALVYAQREHVYQIDTITLMLCSRQWLPLEALHDLPLVEALVRQRRSFLKPLRYDAKSAAAFANALLLDCGAMPVPLHVISAFADDAYKAAKAKALAAAGPGTWVWTTDQAMPALPPPERRAARG